MLQLVLTAIADVESAVIRSGPSAYEQQPGSSSSTTTGGNSNSNRSYLQALEQEFDALMARRGGHATQSEAMFWMIRITAVVSIILLLIFLFLHDY